MEDDKFHCILKALGDAARITVVVNLVIRLTKIIQKRVKRSNSEEP